MYIFNMYNRNALMLYIRVIRKVSFLKKNLPNFSIEFWAEFRFYKVLSEYTAHV